MSKTLFRNNKIYKDFNPPSDKTKLYASKCNYVLGGQAVDGYYNVSPDPRYVAYPPPVQFAQPPLRGPVPPPDVTVLSAPPPLLSTFSYANSIETEGHLV